MTVREEHIVLLKQAIAQNEETLKEIKTLVAELHHRRAESCERHKHPENGTVNSDEGMRCD